MAHDLSKPFQMDKEMTPEQINQHLQEVLEHQMVLSLPDRVYQQQSKMASIQSVAAPIGQADNIGTIGYAPQSIQNSTPHTLDDKRSTLTYGVCVEGHNKTNSSPNQMTKSDSVSEDLSDGGHIKVQKRRTNERRLWGNLVEKEPVLELEKADETQQLLLPDHVQGTSQQFPFLLQERVPALLGERTGSYKQQPVEFLPLALRISQRATSEGESPSSSIPNSLFSVCASNNFSQDPSHLGQWAAWDSLAWTNSQCPPSGFQRTDSCSPASESLKSETEPLSTTPEPSDLPHDNMLLPGLFRDLELKLQWDHEPDENAPIC